MSRSRSARLASALLVVALIVVWDLLIRTKVIDFDTMPSPWATARSWADIIRSGDLTGPILHTMRIFAISFIVATAAGVVLGALIGLSKPGRAYLNATLEFLRFVPPPALIPLVLLITGFTDRSEIVIAAFASLWPVLLNTADGVAVLDPQLREAGRSMCLSRPQMLAKLVMPAALPLIAVGMRLALSLCLIIVITTEIVAIRSGLGFALVSASSALRPGEVYAYMLTVGVLGMAVNLAFRMLERRVLLHHRSLS